MPADKSRGKCDTCGPGWLMVTPEDRHNVMKSSISNLATKWITGTDHQVIANLTPSNSVFMSSSRLWNREPEWGTKQTDCPVKLFINHRWNGIEAVISWGDCLTCLETRINRVSVHLKWQIKGTALMADGAWWLILLSEWTQIVLIHN